MLRLNLPESISVLDLAKEATGVHQSIPASPPPPRHLAATESIPESVSVREILRENQKRWEQFGPLENAR
jgi:hypothetical protein